MTRSMRLSSWPAALGMGTLLVGCAPQTDYSGISTSPITMACDGGRTFTIAYANNFETAVIEAEGQRLELPRIYTSLGMTPTPPGFGAAAIPTPFLGGPEQDQFSQPRGSVAAAGTTGVRYGSDEALFISRNQAAVLQVGDDTYSNCEVART